MSLRLRLGIRLDIETDTPESHSGPAVRQRFRPPAWLAFSTAMLLWLGVIAALVLSIDYFVGVDAYFHYQVASEMLVRGLAFDSFPYASESIWLEHYFDKEWLFHAFLTPFVAAGGADGAKWAILVCNAALVAALWYTLRALDLPRPFWWVLALPLANSGLIWLRISLLRPHLFAAPLFLLAIAAVARRRHGLMLLVGALYSLGHTAHWQLPGMILAYDVLYTIFDRDGQRRESLKRAMPMVVPATVGILIATCLHPHFPNNLHGLYVQNVLVLQTYWQAADILEAVKPSELLPMGSTIFVACFPIFLGVGLAIARICRGRFVYSRIIMMLTIYAGGYGVLTYKSTRFIDYFVPSAILLLACWFHANPIRETLRWKYGRMVIVGMLTTYLLGLGSGQTALGLTLIWALLELRTSQLRQRFPAFAFGLFMLCFSFFGLRSQLIERVESNIGDTRRTHPHAGAAAAIREHVPENGIVVTSNWPETPSLWFGAPKHRYLVFLDPIFFYLHDPKKFRLWHEMRIGMAIDPVGILTQELKASAVVTSQEGSVSFANQLARDPRARQVYQKDDVRVFVLQD
ncbi:MAG: hypothetical protein ACI8W8_001336 [Rhodothermales bacterium]